MKTNELIDLISNPNMYEINKYQPRSSKYTHGIDCELEVNLNGSWHFDFYNNIFDRDENFMTKQTFSRVIQVPSHIELSGYGQVQYVNVQYPWDGVEDVQVGTSPIKTNTVGQYTKFINVADLNDFADFILCFEGVESGFNLWINGSYVGYSTDTFTTSEFQVKQYLKLGINQISVEVYKFTASSWLEDQDFWRFSGIFRDVKLKKITSQHIIDFEINYSICNDKVNTKIDIVRNGTFDIKCEVLDHNNVLIFEGVSSDGFDFWLDNVKLWNAEEPYLYTFNFDTGTEKFSKRIGFRHIEIVDKVITLNGQRIVFKGMNRHEFDPYLGRAIGYKQIRTDLELLKKHNFNAIRCSHYPNNTIFYDICDELGFYVINEVNLETHGTWSTAKFSSGDLSGVLPNDNSNYRDNVLKRAKNLYNRDKNSSSVIMWSLGNESYGGRTLFEMHNYFKNTDSSRLVHYEGVTRDRSYPLTSDVESHMYTRSEDIETYFNNGFEKPFILCEYTHAMGNSNGNLIDYLDLEDKYESYHGGFIWEYMDQAIFQGGKFNYGGDFDECPTDYNFICDGLVGPDREITDKLLYVSNLFSPIRIKEEADKFIVKNNNQFMDFDNLIIKKYIQTEFSKQLIDTTSIQLSAQQIYEVPKDARTGVTLYEVCNNGEVLKVFSQVNYEERQNDEVCTNVHYVEGDKNFGLHSEQFSIMFCKEYNNLISIKYDGKELLESIENSPKPNLWRAPTNNDMGAGIVGELSIWKIITEYSSKKIKSYKYKNQVLYVTIEFTHPINDQYKTTMNYEVKHDGSIIVTTTYTGLENMPNMLNFGFDVNLNRRYNKFTYLGAGEIESYQDRNTELAKLYSTHKISDLKSYLYPQECGNRTRVNYLKVVDDNNQGFIIESPDEFEFSLRNYNDCELEQKRNNSDLVEGAPHLKINHKQSGVGGDDSWENWCKPGYVVSSKEDMSYTITIRRI
ncbi:glycoside hydrolase family 2 TIM barrel-domain containing protein [Mollicutes bacterium LVI A0039]|nr:glycoside hydrolase family 2 TIM barrel-domain containing protein [Mollicutes bacterium LVI A0039]